MMGGEHIFLSYRRASPDKEFAARLAGDLRASGHHLVVHRFGAGQVDIASHLTKRLPHPPLHGTLDRVWVDW